MAIFANFVTVHGFRGSRFGVSEGERNKGNPLRGAGPCGPESKPLNPGPVNA